MHRLATFWTIAFAFMLFSVGCAGLPSEQQVARRYAAEHHGRTVVDVTGTTTGVPQQMKAEFRVTYTEDGHTNKTEVIRYHQVAEGWIRDL